MIYSRISGFTSCFCFSYLFAVSPLPLSHSCLSGRNAPVDACGRQTGLLRPVLVCISIKGVLRLYEAYTTSCGHCLFLVMFGSSQAGCFSFPLPRPVLFPLRLSLFFGELFTAFPVFSRLYIFTWIFSVFFMLCIFRCLFCAECAKKKRNFLKFQEIWLIMIT